MIRRSSWWAVAWLAVGCCVVAACSETQSAVAPSVSSVASHPQSWGTGGGTECTASSEISSNFNGTPIPNGATIWFNAIVDVKNRNNQEATVEFTGSEIEAAGYDVIVPNAEITFSASTSTASTTFDASSNTWVTVVPVNYSGKVFLSGTAVQVPPGGLRGGINPVDWYGNFSSTMTGLNFQWQWGAAVYTSFGANADVEVKPIDANQGSDFMNSDHAGTPENFKSSVTGGARGGGGSNWTGSYSGTAAAVCS